MRLKADIDVSIEYTCISARSPSHGVGHFLPDTSGMFAKSLEYILAERLQGSDFLPDGIPEVSARFESLRAYGLLPRGRENRVKRLSNAEIAAGILSLVSLRPGWAGHAAIVLKDLRPVGGQQASCWGAETLMAAIETILTDANDISMKIDTTPPGDGSEYDAAEAAQARLDALGVTSGSCFLQVGLDTQVTWPKTETLVKFDKFHLVLMPKTATHTQSVHVDLRANRLTREEAMTVVNRFLSTLAWCDNQFAILGHGWVGNPVPVAVPKKDLAFATTSHWVFEREIPNDDKARRALALYREGLNAAEASLSSYAVLSFFKVIELGYRESERVKKWIARSFTAVVSDIESSDSRLTRFLADCGDATPTDYIYDACRLAVAHASIKSPSDADDAKEIRRLQIASDVLQLLARRFITEKFSISQSYFSETQEGRSDGAT